MSPGPPGRRGLRAFPLASGHSLELLSAGTGLGGGIQGWRLVQTRSQAGRQVWPMVTAGPAAHVALEAQPCGAGTRCAQSCCARASSLAHSHLEALDSRERPGRGQRAAGTSCAACVEARDTQGPRGAGPHAGGSQEAGQAGGGSILGLELHGGRAVRPRDEVVFRETARLNVVL